MIRSVILDVDGTLVDSNYLHTEAFARALAEVGHPAPRSAIHRQIGKGSELLIPEFVTGEEQTRRVEVLHDQYFHELQIHAYPLPGAKELIASLAERGYALWVATSASPADLRGVIERLEIEGRVAGIVSSKDVEEAKPEPDLFQLVLRQAGAEPGETIVLGDTIWDVEAAARAGLRTVAVLTGGAYCRDELLAAGAVAVFANCVDVLESGFPEGY